MNMTTKTELAEVSQSNIATLPPAARAAVVLKSEQTRKELVELVKKSGGILTIANKDGREEAHRAAMTLKNTRVAIKSAGELAREDAVAFSRAVIKEAGDLVSIIEPEEKRVLALRDEWDAKIEAEKQAKIAAERARVEAIQGRIEAIRRAPLAVAGESSAAILVTLELVRDKIIDESFAEFSEQAMAARSEALNALEAAHAKAKEAEAAARAAEEARKAEAARIEAERAELARLRAEQAERERLAGIEADRIAAEQAAEGKRIADLVAAEQAKLQAERDRIAAEQAAEARRLAGIAAAQEAEARRRQEVAEAELRAQKEQLAAERAAHEARLQLERDHAEALCVNEQFDIEREAERARLQALADQAAADARERADNERKAGLPAGSLRITEVAGPDDDEIIALVAERYGMSRGEAIERLAAIDFVAAAREAV